MRFNQQANIKVRLTSGVARKVASSPSLKVHASVKGANPNSGTGQATTLILTKLTPALGGLLHLPAG